MNNTNFKLSILKRKLKLMDEKYVNFLNQQFKLPEIKQEIEKFRIKQQLIKQKENLKCRIDNHKEIDEVFLKIKKLNNRFVKIHEQNTNGALDNIEKHILKINKTNMDYLRKLIDSSYISKEYAKLLQRIYSINKNTKENLKNIFELCNLKEEKINNLFNQIGDNTITLQYKFNHNYKIKQNIINNTDFEIEME